MKALALLGLLATCTAKHWHEFKLNYNKAYLHPDEELLRRGVYESNRIWVQEHNSRYEKGLESFQVSMNHFGDLTDEEFKSTYLISNFTEEKRPIERTVQSVINIHPSKWFEPKTVNWTSKGAVSAVMDQGKCGACWAFSAAGALEAQIWKRTGKLVSLSSQNLIDCSWNYGNNGCQGGMPYKALKYIQLHGVRTEKAYPYVGKEEDCHYLGEKPEARMEKFFYLKDDENSEENLKSSVAKIGPISSCMWAGKSFRFFSKGIFYDSSCVNNDEINHAVLVVGYGKKDGRDYWLLKNSWGKQWGEGGYAMMVRNKGNHCNIASHAVYPLL